MFLSDAQLEMINRIYEHNKLDILETHIGVLSALTCRGIAEIYYAKKPGAITKVGLTAIGDTIAENLDFYSALPKYKSELDKARVAKRGLRYE